MEYKGEIEFNNKEQSITIVNHFDGYVCGLITTVRNLVSLKIIKGRNFAQEFDTGEVISYIEIYNRKEYFELKRLINKKIKLYEENKEKEKFYKQLMEIMSYSNILGEIIIPNVESFRGVCNAYIDSFGLVYIKNTFTQTDDYPYDNDKTREENVEMWVKDKELYIYGVKVKLDSYYYKKKKNLRYHNEGGDINDKRLN